MGRNHFLYGISCLGSFAPLFSLTPLPASHHNWCCCRLLPKCIPLLWLLTSKHVYQFNLMKMVPISISLLGSLSLNFIASSTKMHPVTLVTNIKTCVPIQHDEDGNNFNFNTWVTLFKLHCQAHLVDSHIGSLL